MSDHRRSVRLAAAVSSILSAPAIAVGAGLVMALATAPLAQAQETASQMSGYVVSTSGEPIAGAQVTIVHVPSNTSSTVTTTNSGQFIATGLRVGGPYRVSAKAEGMQDTAVENLYAQLGQRTSVTLVAQPIVQLAGVEVTGASERDVTIGAGNCRPSVATSRTSHVSIPRPGSIRPTPTRSRSPASITATTRSRSTACARATTLASTTAATRRCVARCRWTRSSRSRS